MKKIGKSKKCQRISSRKKTIILFFLAFLFSFAITTEAQAQSCSDGGTCTPGYSRICPTGEQYLGLYNCPDSAPNCCKKSSAAGGTTGGDQSSGFGNPLACDSFECVLLSILSYLRTIAGTIAVIFIIIGGIMYMISGGSKEMTERAKKTLIFAIAGLAIVLAAPLFYQEIKAVLSGDSPGSALQQLLINILKLLLSIVGFLAIITMVIGGIWMLTAVGDEDRYELGKKTATYSIIGLVIAVASLIIATQVTNLIGAPNSPSLSPSSLPSGWNRGGQD